MFKSIKEFFTGKPTQPEVEVKAELPPVQETSPVAPEPVAVAPGPAPVPVVEEIKVTTVTLNDQITDAVTVTAKPDTVPTGAWPFPGGDKPEEQKKKRTFVKREEPAIKPTPAIKVIKNKPRKKK